MDGVLEIKTLKYDEKVIFEKLVMSTNFKRIPKFFSENEACFMFLEKGGFQFRTPTKVISFSSGDGMLAKCGNYFLEQVTIAENTNGETISAVGAYFYPSIVKEFFQKDLSIRAFQSNFDTKKLNVEPLLKSFIESITYLLDHPELADDNLILNKLKELLLLLSKSENAESIESFVSSLFIKHEYDFSEIIGKNIFSNLSLQEFSTLCNCSVATFKRKFNELYKTSPSKYFLEKRLERSSQLLQLKSKPIADIAYECGFESASNFNKAFKKHFGKAPSEFRVS